jgi:serine/threonine protein kinase
MKQGDLMQFLKEREQGLHAAAGAGAGGGAGVGGTDELFAPPTKSVASTGYTVLTDLEYWNIFRQVTAGVRYLHFQQIVHGDIKPQNLLVSEDGVVKIADFGISKMMSKSNHEVQDAAGTPAFMSPELWEMHQGNSVSGPQADVWALGGTMFMLRYGHPPYVANSILMLGNKIRNDPLIFPQPIDNGLKDLLENMLVKDPSKRFTLEKVLIHPYLRQPPAVIPRTAGARPLQQHPPNGTGSATPHGRAPIPSGKSIDFRPPDSYHQQEQAAMNLYVNNISQKDIFASIGGVNKSSKRSGKGGSSSSDLKTNVNVQLNMKEEEEDIMITGWGGDVFEHVDDVEIDSDVDEDEVDDEEVDSPRSSSKPSAELPATGDVPGAGAVAGRNDRNLKTGSMDSSGSLGQLPVTSSFISTASNSNPKPDMSIEEEERRLKRFQQLQTKKSFDYSKAEEMSVKSSMGRYNKYPSLGSVGNTGLGIACVSEASDQSGDSLVNNSKNAGVGSVSLSRVSSGVAGNSSMGSGNGASSSPSPSSKHANRRSKKLVGTPSNDGNEDEDEETETVDMEGFAKMMDTLAQQPKRLSSEMETALTTLDLSETVLSTQYKNELNGIKAAFYSERGPRPTQEDRCVLLPDMSAMNGLADYDFGDEGRSKQLLAKFSVGGVFDGHSGWRTSEYLCQHLCPMLAVHPKLLEKHIDAAIIETFAEIEKEVCAVLRHV